MSRILRLQAANLKRIRVIDITPGETLVPITGDNEAGKSCVLDSIIYALGGTKEHAAQPIRKGASKAKVVLTLENDITVSRVWTKSGSTLQVTRTSDGTVVPKGQTVLSEMLGAITLDPMAIDRMTSKEQLEMLRKLVKLDIDLDAVDRQIHEAREARTEMNRQVKTFSERASSLSKAVDDSVVDPIDTAALMDKMQQAAEHNTAIERERQNCGVNRTRIISERERAATLRRQAEELLREAQLLEDKALRLEQELDSLEPIAEPIDVSDVRLKLQEAEKENQRRTVQRGARIQYQEAKAKLDAATRQSDRLTQIIEDAEESKRAAMSRAQMPIEGLAFGEDALLYNGLPIAQASTGQRMRVFTAIGIAMNPKIRILLFKDAALLGEKNKAMIHEMAKEHGFQVWLEITAVGSKEGFELVDGSVVSIDGQPVDGEESEDDEEQRLGPKLVEAGD